MTEEIETVVGGNSVVLFDDRRDEVGGLERLKTMNCDEIYSLLGDAYVSLQRNKHHLMANGAATHFGEKLVDLPFQWLGPPSQGLNLGPQVHFKDLKTEIFITRVATGTDLIVRDLTPAN